MEQVDICRKLQNELELCRDDLYKYIKNDTPAMKSIPYIVNKPGWIKEPSWFQNIKK